MGLVYLSDLSPKFCCIFLKVGKFKEAINFAKISLTGSLFIESKIRKRSTATQQKNFKIKGKAKIFFILHLIAFMRS